MIARELEKAGVTIDEKACERLRRYTQLLVEWNATHNLTGAKNREEIRKHIVDALIPLGFVDAPNSLLDVGTGAGFPGLVLAAAWPETETVLCEPLKKRSAFLRLAALEMGLDRVEVARKRVEELQHAPFEMISSRAVSDTALLLKLTEHLRDEKTRYLLYKGSRIAEELTRVGGFEAQIHERPPRRYLILSRG
ncbi:16S rRNA (guanine(527)-N(7))-methyltransferase RsmG [Nitratifractor sp.]